MIIFKELEICQINICEDSKGLSDHVLDYEGIDRDRDRAISDYRLRVVRRDIRYVARWIDAEGGCDRATAQIGRQPGGNRESTAGSIGNELRTIAEKIDSRREIAE